jgi:GNAT superfamily N-acetyltransferase
VAFPSAIAQATGCGLIAFAFTTTFAPDILELANILVDSNWRNHDIGSQLLQVVEELAKERFNAIILVNSMLYSTVGKKRPATEFYRRAGYESILQTSDSLVFSKSLL